MGRKITTTALAFLLASNSFADTNSTATQKATATLNSSCVISVIDIDFGEIAKTGSSRVPSSTGNISLNCSNKLAYKITLNIGVNATGNSPMMIGNISGEKINYGICRYSYSSGLSNPTCGPDTKGWLNPISNPVYGFITGTGNGIQQNIPIYGFAGPCK